MKIKTIKKSGLRVNTTKKKSVKKPPNIPTNQTLVKATFYFSPNQLRELERIKFELLEKYGIKTDKSAIMRKVLDLAIKDANKLIKQFTKLTKNW